MPSLTRSLTSWRTPRNEQTWNPDLLEIRRLGDGPVTAGVEWEARYKGLGLTQIKLDDYERPTPVVFDTTGKGGHAVEFTFSPGGAGIRLVAHSEMHPKGVMRLLAPVMVPMVKHMFAKRRLSSPRVSPPPACRPIHRNEAAQERLNAARWLVESPGRTSAAAG